MDRRRSNAFSEAFMVIMLAWAAWISLAMLDAKERVARIETKIESLTRAEVKPAANAKTP